MIVSYFTGAGHSRAVAEYFSSRLAVPAYDISDADTSVDTAVIVFPVYCQNIPRKVREYLSRLHADSIVIVAVYGGKSYGNVIYEASRLVNAPIIAAACIATGHTFLGESTDFDTFALEPLFERISEPHEAVLRRMRKSIYADFFPAWRSRTSVKITRTSACTSCGKCSDVCPEAAINHGAINKNCIRCMRCVTECPEHALTSQTRHFLISYLKDRKNITQLFL